VFHNSQEIGWEDGRQNELHWVTLTFDLACRWAFRWAKVRSKSRLK